VARPEPDALARALLEAVRDGDGRAAGEHRARALADALAWDRLAAVLDGFYGDVLNARAVPLAVSA
jgi:hypothetical protein